MSLSFTNSSWNDSSFDRKAPLRWTLQALELAVHMVDTLTDADLRSYIQHVEDIFQPHLPAPARGSISTRPLMTSRAIGGPLREEH